MAQNHVDEALKLQRKLRLEEFEKKLASETARLGGVTNAVAEYRGLLGNVEHRYFRLEGEPEMFCVCGGDCASIREQVEDEIVRAEEGQLLPLGDEIALYPGAIGLISNDSAMMLPAISSLLQYGVWEICTPAEMAQACLASLEEAQQELDAEKAAKKA